MLHSLRLVSQALHRYDVLLALGGIEVNRQLYALGLVDSEGQIRFFLQVFQTESLQVLFSKSLSIKDSSSGSLFSLLRLLRVILATRQKK